MPVKNIKEAIDIAKKTIMEMYPKAIGCVLLQGSLFIDIWTIMMNVVFPDNRSVLFKIKINKESGDVIYVEVIEP